MASLIPFPSPIIDHLIAGCENAGGDRVDVCNLLVSSSFILHDDRFFPTNPGILATLA